MNYFCRTILQKQKDDELFQIDVKGDDRSKSLALFLIAGQKLIRRFRVTIAQFANLCRGSPLPN
jgi:hypothetical protein